MDVDPSISRFRQPTNFKKPGSAQSRQKINHTMQEQSTDDSDYQSVAEEGVKLFEDDVSVEDSLNFLGLGPTSLTSHDM